MAKRSSLPPNLFNRDEDNTVSRLLLPGPEAKARLQRHILATMTVGGHCRDWIEDELVRDTILRAALVMEIPFVENPRRVVV